jgi:hypothetical protein
MPLKHLERKYKKILKFNLIVVYPKKMSKIIKKIKIKKESKK